MLAPVKCKKEPLSSAAPIPHSRFPAEILSKPPTKTMMIIKLEIDDFFSFFLAGDEGVLKTVSRGCHRNRKLSPSPVRPRAPHGGLPFSQKSYYPRFIDFEKNSLFSGLSLLIAI